MDHCMLLAWGHSDKPFRPMTDNLVRRLIDYIVGCFCGQVRLFAALQVRIIVKNNGQKNKSKIINI